MKKDKEKSINLSFLSFLAVLLLGVLGGVLSFFYLWPVFFGNHFSLNREEIDLNSPEYDNTNLVIQDAKKVYISQDLKVEESTNYLNEVVVGIFPKIKNNNDINKNNYIIEKEILSGIVISSDGWVLINVLDLDNFDKNILKNKDSYIIISKKNKKIYNIEEVIDFSKNGMIFVKIKDNNSFSVRNFVNISDLRNGQSALAYNFSGELMISSLKNVDSGDFLKSFKSFKNLILLNSLLPDDFKNSFLFNLNGDLLGLIDSNLNIRPIHDFRSYIYGFLKTKELQLFDLGLYYVDLEDIANENLPQNGAWVYNNGSSAVIKGGLADLVGIKTGDIITRVNNYEINNFSNLNDVLNNFVVGDKVNMFILRNGEVNEIKIDLK